MANDPLDLNYWYTPNTYDANCKDLPESPGVYLLVLREIILDRHEVRNTILYVGSSDNPLQRCKYHPVKRKILSEVQSVNIVDVVCYFKVCNDYRVREKRLIKLTQARYNKQWR